MKFLVKIEPLNAIPANPKESLQLLLASLDYWDRIIKSGKAVGGNFAEGQGGGGIVEVESLKELNAMLSGAPNAGMIRYEVHGLTSIEDGMKVVRQQLEDLQKTRK
ncbi:MAG: hypothetical protein JSW53_04960 [Candidatus Bathyarchaeota archaeon]|nr:MAG: hypothetical protein JSW53_04960 [Candidatus Bathyarchaeota archaeon]